MADGKKSSFDKRCEGMAKEFVGRLPDGEAKKAIQWATIAMMIAEIVIPLIRQCIERTQSPAETFSRVTRPGLRERVAIKHRVRAVLQEDNGDNKDMSRREARQYANQLTDVIYESGADVTSDEFNEFVRGEYS